MHDIFDATRQIQDFPIATDYFRLDRDVQFAKNYLDSERISD